MKKRITVIILIICLSLVLCGSTLSKPHDDTAVIYLQECGISNGCGESFGGDSYITVEQLSAMLARMTGQYYDGSWKDVSSKYVKYSLDKQWLDESFAENPTQYLSLADFCNIFVNFLDIRQDVGYNGVNNADVWICYQLGLIEPSMMKSVFITRNQAANFLYVYLVYQHDTVQYLEIKNIEKSKKLAFGDKYFGNLIERIPVWMIEKFNQYDYTLYLGKEYMEQFYPDMERIVGITDFKNSRIVVYKSYSTIYHEFGHFCFSNLYDSSFKEIYSKESSISHLEDYYKNSLEEYFVECFSNYILGKTDRFKDIPLTYDYFNELRKKGWKK